MRRRIRLFVLLSVLNLALFLFRNHLRYEDYSDEIELYNESLAYWDDYLKPYSPSLQQMAPGLMAIDKSNGPDSIAREIAKRLIFISRNKIGNPDSLFMHSEPPLKYVLLRNKEQKAECGNLAEIYAYFCNANGVPCRYIEIRGKEDFHVVNEYFAGGKWKLVDITYGLGNVNQTLLQYRKNATRGFLRNRDSLIPEAAENYYIRPAELYYYRYSNTDYAYNPLNKLRSYFFPYSWYKIYSDSERDYVFIPLVRLIAFLFWAFALTGLIIHYFRYRNDRSKKPEERI